MAAPIIVADSITRVGSEAAGAVVVNASHGGIYAAYLVAKLRAAAAIFNDAAVGRDGAGIGGLHYLQQLGIAAATVGYDTSRIGDSADMMASGIITHANELAAGLGVAAGQTCPQAAARLQAASATDHYARWPLRSAQAIGCCCTTSGPERICSWRSLRRSSGARWRS